MRTEKDKTGRVIPNQIRLISYGVMSSSMVQKVKERLVIMIV